MALYSGGEVGNTRAQAGVPRDLPENAILLVEMQAPHRSIPTRHELLTPKGVDRQAVEMWVRRWTKRRIRLDDEFVFARPDESAKTRAKLLKFARVLQAELLHHENWDGTPRT